MTLNPGNGGATLLFSRTRTVLCKKMTQQILCDFENTLITSIKLIQVLPLSSEEATGTATRFQVVQINSHDDDVALRIGTM